MDSSEVACTLSILKYFDCQLCSKSGAPNCGVALGRYWMTLVALLMTLQGSFKIPSVINYDRNHLYSTSNWPLQYFCKLRDQISNLLL
jgi:hypothetical protein